MDIEHLFGPDPDDLGSLFGIIGMIGIIVGMGLLLSPPSCSEKQKRYPLYPPTKIERAVSRELIGDLDGDGIREIVLKYDSCGTRFETLYSRKYSR